MNDINLESEHSLLIDDAHLEMQANNGWGDDEELLIEGPPVVVNIPLEDE